MSGGYYGYIQSKSATDLLEDGDTIAEMKALGEGLAGEFGITGKLASDATLALAEQFKTAYQARHEKESEFDAAMRPLRHVWRQMDYWKSGDVSRDDVIAALAEYATVQAAEAVAAASLGETLAAALGSQRASALTECSDFEIIREAIMRIAAMGAKTGIKATIRPEAIALHVATADGTPHALEFEFLQDIHQGQLAALHLTPGGPSPTTIED